MNYFKALAPVSLTLLAMIFQPSFPREQPCLLAIASGLALLWLLFILTAASARILSFYLLNWFLMLILLLLRIKINLEGVIELPRFYDWMSNSILLPFYGLIDLYGNPHQWTLAALLGTLFCLIILARLGWLQRKAAN